MELLIVGQHANLEEAHQKFGELHHYRLSSNHSEAEGLLNQSDVVFDFIISDNPSAISAYRNHPSLAVFLNTSFVSLSQLQAPSGFFGFCGMPTFLNRELMEVSVASEGDRAALEKICGKLNTRYEVVADRVGLVTPRIICMIINEAYHTVEEGTATREDIDLAMKLGTNYPFGPFEWSERIGRRNVSRLLDAMLKETQDARYKVCQLLKAEADANI